MMELASSPGSSQCGKENHAAEYNLHSAETQVTGERVRLVPSSPILHAGETCWKIARADRFAVIIDAAEYFARAKAAMLKARHSILLIGWDFDLRIRLTPDQADDGEVRLGEFLRSLVRRRPDLRIYILKWDMAVLYTLRWQSIPRLFTDLVQARHIHLRFDSTHPATSAHHQKIVVIDDAIAFCGGIDMTDDRWDTRGHRPSDGHRVNPQGAAYGPWHDSTTAVDGDAARALGVLARQRWLFATGQRLPIPDPSSDAWPEGLVPQLRDVDVGIARTMPPYEGRDAAHEIEALYIAAIRSARRLIYIESQFFAASRVVDALLERLKQLDGPEIIVVNPLHGESWLEEETMDCARALLLKRIRAADHHNRFRIYYPVNDAGDPIYVHSKVLVTDDRLLQVGSSNLNNRSMGFDSECDLAIEAANQNEDERAAIAKIRNSLLGEHLDRSVADVAQVMDEEGSAVCAVERLCRSQGRTLVPLPVCSINEVEEAVANSRIADPEPSAVKEGIVEHAVKRLMLRRPIGASAGLLSLIFAACFLARPRSGDRRRDQQL